MTEFVLKLTPQKKKTTLSEHYKNPIGKSEKKTKFIPLIQIH
jgi:hypothetical protein